MLLYFKISRLYFIHFASEFGKKEYEILNDELVKEKGYFYAISDLKRVLFYRGNIQTSDEFNNRCVRVTVDRNSMERKDCSNRSLCWKQR